MATNQGLALAQMCKWLPHGRTGRVNDVDESFTIFRFGFWLGILCVENLGDMIFKKGKVFFQIPLPSTTKFKEKN